jgi:protein involved in polysaccharide export with SLBB domain
MRNKHSITAILLLMAGLTQVADSTSVPTNHQDQITATQRRSKFAPEYFIPHSPEERKLQIGDEVEIGVFGQRDTIAENVPVAPDGKLYYMFLPGIMAEGRTAEEVASLIYS